MPQQALEPQAAHCLSRRWSQRVLSASVARAEGVTQIPWGTAPQDLRREGRRNVSRLLSRHCSRSFPRKTPPVTERVAACAGGRVHLISVGAMRKEPRRGRVEGSAPVLRCSAHGPHLEHLHGDTTGSHATHSSCGRCIGRQGGNTLVCRKNIVSQGQVRRPGPPKGNRAAGVATHVLDALQG